MADFIGIEGAFYSAFPLCANDGEGGKCLKQMQGHVDFGQMKVAMHKRVVLTEELS